MDSKSALDFRGAKVVAMSYEEEPRSITLGQNEGSKDLGGLGLMNDANGIETTGEPIEGKPVKKALRDSAAFAGNGVSVDWPFATP